jgi:hypothetical protein
MSKMESTEQTMIDTYFSYWKDYIQPIEEEKRRAQFDEILIDVGLHLYGIEFALELALLFLKAQNLHLFGESNFDL